MYNKNKVEMYPVQCAHLVFIIVMPGDLYVIMLGSFPLSTWWMYYTKTSGNEAICGCLNMLINKCLNRCYVNIFMSGGQIILEGVT